MTDNYTRGRIIRGVASVGEADKFIAGLEREVERLRAELQALKDAVRDRGLRG